MRDEAHAKALSSETAPFDSHNACIYHSGPLVASDDDRFRVMATGPTTST